MRIRTKPQVIGEFEPCDPHKGYYSDLRDSALRYGGTPEAATEGLDALIADRTTANPVSIVQLGIGAWQLHSQESAWRDVVARVVKWLLDASDDDGRLAYLFPMPHTYDLSPPWYSAMAQGEAASLLTRAARTLADPELEAAGARLATSLVDPTLGLIAETDEGPVLQEYPTTPPAHVLNGWITALWGLYDLAHGVASVGSECHREHAESFSSGVEALTARLRLYRIGRGWSRYDLFPHPLPNVASPFYHRMHVDQLAALNQLSPHAELARTSAEWQSGLGRPLTVGVAVTRKVAFRVARPRSRWALGRLRSAT
jgi:hypothetical protein